MTDRHGASVAEAMVALLATLLILQLSLDALSSGRRLASELLLHIEGVEAVRITRAVLSRELRVGVANRDWIVFPPDSISLRAFRGVGLVCPHPEPGEEVLVAWSGSRHADAAKDSLLVLASDGTWSVADLVTVRAAVAGACAADPSRVVERWTLSPAPQAPAALVRYFERGSYHLAGDALRYRVGVGGRQPLTAQVVATPPSGFGVTDDAANVTLTEGGAGVWSWHGVLPGSASR